VEGADPAVEARVGYGGVIGWLLSWVAGLPALRYEQEVFPDPSVETGGCAGVDLAVVGRLQSLTC